jgi:putative endonuclease
MAWPEVKKFVSGIFNGDPEHLRHGRIGEAAAKKYLRKQGLKYLCANFKVEQIGEIDLIFRHEDCLCFIEVKTRSSEEWTRPAAAVDREKRRRLVKTALAYRRKLPNPYVKYRYDIAEVLLDGGEVTEVRYITNAFNENLRKR